MNIDKEQIKHLLWLARIEVDENRLEVYEEQINKIIKYLDMLDEVNIDVEPNYQIANINQFRDDVVKYSKDDVFNAIINKKDRFVKAPKI